MASCWGETVFYSIYDCIYNSKTVSPQHDAITGNSIYDCICNSKTVSPQHDAITGHSIYDCICNSMAFLLMLDY
jgi:hypothetical protein